MRQARRWLLLTAALVLLPMAAYAQKKPAPGKNAAPAASAAAGGGGAVSADDEPAKPADSSSPSATPPVDTGPGGNVGVCEATPDAPECKGGAVNLSAEAKKTFKAEIYAVQQIYALRYHRFEIQPYWSFSLNDQFVSHPGPGLALNYYITNVLAIGLNGNFYGGLNGDSDFNFQNRRATRVAVPLNEYQWGANVNFTYVPM